MMILIAGLVLFLGAHSVRIFADDWRTAMVARLGATRSTVEKISCMAGLCPMMFSN